MGSKQLQITYSMWFYRDRKGLGANEQQTASSFLKWQQGEAGNSNKGFLWAATVSSGQAGASQDTDRDGLILTLSHPQGCGLQAYNVAHWSGCAELLRNKWHMGPRWDTCQTGSNLRFGKRLKFPNHKYLQPG